MKSRKTEMRPTPDKQAIHLAVCEAILNFWPVKILYADLKKSYPDANPSELRRIVADTFKELALLEVAEFFITKDGDARDLLLDEALKQLDGDDCWESDGIYLAANRKSNTDYFHKVIGVLEGSRSSDIDV